MIMLVAGVVTILFHRLKQPVVLGYIVAGFIIGPHTPPFGLIHDEDTIKTLAELGVIFLMFCLGLEFSLRKLFKVGATSGSHSSSTRESLRQLRGHRRSTRIRVPSSGLAGEWVNWQSLNIPTPTPCCRRASY